MAKQDGPTKFVPIGAINGQDGIDDHPPSVHSSEFEEEANMSFGEAGEEKAGSI